MAGNPLVNLGTLNRVRASVTLTDNPQLNVTSSFLGKNGVSMRPKGKRTTQLEQMTGAVQSPEPYVAYDVEINLLRTTALAQLWQQQEQLSTVIGDLTIRPDVSGSGVLGLYELVNGAIDDVQELRFAGQDAGYVVMLTAYYEINSQLWNT
jgi:hypothetical protein